MPQVYIAMSGSGKSTLCRNNSNCLDMPVLTSAYDMSRLVKNNAESVFVNPFPSFELRLKKQEIDPIVILPSPEMKDELLARIQAREPNTEWLDKYAEIYDNCYTRLSECSFRRIYLQPGQYLSDIFDESGKLKSDIEIITPIKEELQ